MTIDPEIIPSSSSLGEDASTIEPERLNFIYVLISLICLAFILKAIFSSILIVLGLWFIWRQATKKLSN